MPWNNLLSRQWLAGRVVNQSGPHSCHVSRCQLPDPCSRTRVDLFQVLVQALCRLLGRAGSRYLVGVVLKGQGTDLVTIVPASSEPQFSGYVNQSFTGLKGQKFLQDVSAGSGLSRPVY